MSYLVSSFGEADDRKIIYCTVICGENDSESLGRIYYIIQRYDINLAIAYSAKIVSRCTRTNAGTLNCETTHKGG